VIGRESGEVTVVAMEVDVASELGVTPERLGPELADAPDVVSACSLVQPETSIGTTTTTTHAKPSANAFV
jgi:hypothetical protein